MSETGRRYAHLVIELSNEMVAWAQSVSTGRFYEAPEPGEWSVMENLAHAVEFVRYWADAVASVVERPGQPFGRTHDDAARIAWVAEHGKDDPEQVLAALDDAAAYAAQRLAAVPEDAWRMTTGLHANRGEMTLPAIVEFFLTDHLRNHLEQAQKAYSAVPS